MLKNIFSHFYENDVISESFFWKLLFADSENNEAFE